MKEEFVNSLCTLITPGRNRQGGKVIVVLLVLFIALKSYHAPVIRRDFYRSCIIRGNNYVCIVVLGANVLTLFLNANGLGGDQVLELIMMLGKVFAGFVAKTE